MLASQWSHDSKPAKRGLSVPGPGRMITSNNADSPRLLTMWLNVSFCEFGSVRSAASSSCCAARTPAVVSASATRCLASSKPCFTWSRTTRPSKATTTAETNSVVATTRSSRDWRQRWTSQWVTGGVSLHMSCGAGLVADTAHGHDDLRVLGVDLDLRPETLHMHVNEPGVRCVPVAPDRLEQRLPREHGAWLARQRDKEVELQRSERDLLVTA